MCSIGPPLPGHRGAVTSARYVRPVVRGFASAKFLGALENERRALLDRLPPLRDGGEFSQIAVWLSRKGELRSTKPIPAWRPKIYLTVRSESFWKVVGRLMGDPVLPKLCMGFKVFVFGEREADPSRGYLDDECFTRPDKIVFYLPDVAAIAPLCRHLRRLKKGAGVHSLGHAGSVGHYRLIQKSESPGLYLGLDPTFLKQSWRIYRAICLSWLSVNRAEVRAEYGSVASWLDRMNLSTRVEGPVRLRPTAAQTRFVGREWKKIVPKGFRQIV